MSGDLPDEGERRLVADASEEWIERIADEKGLTPDEVVEQLVSSYWTLQEMHVMLEGTEDDQDDGLDLFDLDAAYSDILTDDLSEIRERLERLEEAEHDTSEDQSTADLRAEQTRLAERMATVKRSLDIRVSSLESRFDDEFENLETILDYLLETTDILEAELAPIVSEHETSRHRLAEQDRLIDLKRLASRLGVRSATCEHCDTSVEIALLPTPDCPKCDREFTDIEPSTGWFGFGAHTLEVTGDPYIDSSSGSDSTMDFDATGEEGNGGTDRTRSGRFVWGRRES